MIGSADPGEGLRAGDLELSPRARLSGAYDQNVFRLNPGETDGDTLTGAPIMKLAPGLEITTLDATNVDVTFDGELEWEQYFSARNAIQSQSGLQGNGLLGVTLNPNGGLSLKLKEDLTYRNQAPPYPAAQSWDRLVNSAGADVIIHPGDEILTTTLGYDYEIFRYFTPRLRNLNKDSHNFKLDFNWRFLPKTSFVIDGRASLVRYQQRRRGFEDGSLPNVNSNPISGRAGLSGLITRRISTRLLGGYGVGLYEEGASYAGPIGRADVTFKYGNLNLENKITIGYERDYQDANVGNYYAYHRGIFKLRQNFMQKRFGVSVGAEFSNRDWTNLEADKNSRGNYVVDLPSGQVEFDDLEDNSLDINLGLHGQFRKWWQASLNYSFEANFSPNQIDIGVPGRDRVTLLREYRRHLVTLSTTFKY